MSGLLAGRWPAVVESYDQGSRTCVITVPGVTDGAESGLVAEIEYPIGDKSRHGTLTEIEILPNDLVWIEFIQGDPRFPIITGARNPTKGNSVDWRRWHHANVEILADKQMRLIAGESLLLQVGGTTITLTPEQLALAAAAIAAKGPVTQTGGDMTSDGISAQKHTHIEKGDGKPVGPPQ